MQSESPEVWSLDGGELNYGSFNHLLDRTRKKLVESDASPRGIEDIERLERGIANGNPWLKDVVTVLRQLLVCPSEDDRQALRLFLNDLGVTAVGIFAESLHQGFKASALPYDNAILEANSIAEISRREDGKTQLIAFLLTSAGPSAVRTMSTYQMEKSACDPWKGVWEHQRENVPLFLVIADICDLLRDT